MTRKEEIINAASEYCKNTDYSDYDGMDVYDIFIAGAEWADRNQPSPWISVEDELPKCKWDERVSKNHSDYCVVLQADGSMYVAQYFCDFETWSETLYIYIYVSGYIILPTGWRYPNYKQLNNYNNE